jgi:polyisoprenoid-binding protein YceI
LKTFFISGALLALTACSQPNNTSSASSTSTPIAITPATTAPAGKYTLEKSHASLLIRVNRLGLSHYTGRFKNFDATVVFDPNNLPASSVTAVIDASSLEFDNALPGFSELLLGNEWLYAANYPRMVFRSTKVEMSGVNQMLITGELLMMGITQKATLNATFNGGYVGHKLDPQARIGFSAQGFVNRSEFNITLGLPKPGSNRGMGDQVEIIIEAEFTGAPFTRDAT